jgi:hypothetical protein
LIALTACSGGGDFGFNQNGDPITDPDGSAAMELSATEFHFEDVMVRQAQSETLVVTSTGDIPLEIEEGIITGTDRDEFYTDEQKNAGVVVDPGETQEIVIVIDAHESRTVEATFHLNTNASPQPTVDLPLTGTPPTE